MINIGHFQLTSVIKAHFTSKLFLHPVERIDIPASCTVKHHPATPYGLLKEIHR